MNKFKPAKLDDAEILKSAGGWFVLWENGDPNTRKVINEIAGHEVNNSREAWPILLEFTKQSFEGSVWLNDKYQVIRREHKQSDGKILVHLSIKRLDKSPVDRDWRDYQAIKNQLIGEECEAIELFPAESRLVDNANQFHLWGWLDETYRVNVGWAARMVSNTPVSGAQQRPLEEGGFDD